MAMQMAADVFEITPKLGREGRSLVAAKIEQVFSPLQTAVFLFQNPDDQPSDSYGNKGGEHEHEHEHGQEMDGGGVCLICSHFMTHDYRFSNLLRRAVAAELGLPMRQVLSFSSHNHCVTNLVEQQYSFGVNQRDRWIDREELTEDGRALIDGACATAPAHGAA